MKKHYTSPILKLSTEEKPDATKIDNGSTLYEVNTGKFYICYEGQWYDQDFE